MRAREWGPAIPQTCPPLRILPEATTRGRCDPHGRGPQQGGFHCTSSAMLPRVWWQERTRRGGEGKRNCPIQQQKGALSMRGAGPRPRPQMKNKPQYGQMKRNPRAPRRCQRSKYVSPPAWGAILTGVLAAIRRARTMSPVGIDERSLSKNGGVSPPGGKSSTRTGITRAVVGQGGSLEPVRVNWVWAHEKAP